MQVTTANDGDRVAIIGLNQSQAFGIDQSPETMHILADGLYQHKIQAVVRETLCNGWDGHIYSNQPDRPLHVTLTRNEYTVRDFGHGIPKDDVHGTYCIYGYSSKREDASQTGGFGFGSKAPWAYSDIWSLTVSAKDEAERTIYSVVRVDPNNNGYPSLLPVVTVPVTDPEDTGITVSIPINDRDYEYFERHIQNIAFFSGHKVILNGAELPSLSSAGEIPDQQRWFFTPTDSYNGQSEYLLLKIGAVTYSVPSCDSDSKYYSLSTRLQAIARKVGANLVINVSDLPIKPTPSREAVQATPTAIAALETVFADTLTTMNKSFMEVFTNTWQWLGKQESIISEYLYQAACRNQVYESDYRLVNFMCEARRASRTRTIEDDWGLFSIALDVIPDFRKRYTDWTGLTNERRSELGKSYTLMANFNELAYCILVRQGQDMGTELPPDEVTVCTQIRRKFIKRMTNQMPKKYRKLFTHILGTTVYQLTGVSLISELYRDKQGNSGRNTAYALVNDFYKRARRQIEKSSVLNMKKAYRVPVSAQHIHSRYSCDNLTPENLRMNSHMYNSEPSLLELIGTMTPTVILTRSRAGLLDSFSRIDGTRYIHKEVTTDLARILPMVSHGLDGYTYSSTASRYNKLLQLSAGRLLYEVTTSASISKKLEAEIKAVTEEFSKLGYQVIDLISPSEYERKVREAERARKAAEKEAQKSKPITLQRLFDRLWGYIPSRKGIQITRSHNLSSVTDLSYIDNPEYIVLMPKESDYVGRSLGFPGSNPELECSKLYRRFCMKTGVARTKTQYNEAITKGSKSLDEIVLRLFIDEVKACSRLPDVFWAHAEPSSSMLKTLELWPMDDKGEPVANIPIYDRSIRNIIVTDRILSMNYFKKDVRVSSYEQHLIKYISSSLGSDAIMSKMWPELHKELVDYVKTFPNYDLMRKFDKDAPIFPQVQRTLDLNWIKHLLLADQVHKFEYANKLRQVVKSVISFES